LTKAGNTPINVSAPGSNALDIQTLAQRGGSMPKVVKDFLTRVTDPNKGPITFAEARDFYFNASRLSADEMGRLTPNMKRMVGQFTADLNQALTDAAGKVGMGKKYEQAMQEYHSAMQNQARIENAKNALGNWVKGGLKLGAGYEVLRSLTGDSKK